MSGKNGYFEIDLHSPLPEGHARIKQFDMFITRADFEAMLADKKVKRRKKVVRLITQCLHAIEVMESKFAGQDNYVIGVVGLHPQGGVETYACPAEDIISGTVH